MRRWEKLILAHNLCFRLMFVRTTLTKLPFACAGWACRRKLVLCIHKCSISFPYPFIDLPPSSSSCLCSKYPFLICWNWELCDPRSGGWCKMKRFVDQQNNLLIQYRGKLFNIYSGDRCRCKHSRAQAKEKISNKTSHKYYESMNNNVNKRHCMHSRVSLLNLWAVLKYPLDFS